MEGFETSDDAAVYRLGEELAGVLTADFFTPIVDDPYEFGRIAAANALSDIFAMGAKPLIALNLLMLDSALGTDTAAAILRGGNDAVMEAGALVVGGHTVDDEEPKYGLAVFGTVHPNSIVRNRGAVPGDVLYLTKPLGTGILGSAFKIGSETEESMRPAIVSMMELNAAGSQAMIAADAHCATDITGFGLLGHLHEMLEASGCSATLFWPKIPLFDRVWEYSQQYCRPSRCFTLMDYAARFVTCDITDADDKMAVLCDPQTSGGLLIAIAQEKADCFEREFESLSGKAPYAIGTVSAGLPGEITLKD